MERITHKIDASDKSPGRLAANIASLLRGKRKADFEPHKDEGDEVLVSNVSQMKITGRKAEQKKYYRHTGFPGGLRTEAMKDLLKTKPEEVLRKAVWGMIPQTRLKKAQMKRLKFE
ncbi:MAG: 50S ribosomal protein L13 [Candidatus Wildermuthbacteria bacterium]|nr:50S ribosomal protein L13 [Candidatus Wildermuthbacteria bacterium]